MNEPWDIIFEKYKILKNDFNKTPFLISAEEIKKATSKFKKTNQREVRILCKQDTRESRPVVFQENNLFILPIKNGFYAIVKGEGYYDIEEIKSELITYNSKLQFVLETSKVGNSEMQHLDYAYASSLIRTYFNDDSLVLTIRGRKYTPEFSFRVGNQILDVNSVQTEVDAGYEGKDKIVLVEAKNTGSKNTIIRQLYYPFRQWQHYTNKKVIPIFFEKNKDYFSIYEFDFLDKYDYNSITLKNSRIYRINDIF